MLGCDHFLGFLLLHYLEKYRLGVLYNPPELEMDPPPTVRLHNGFGKEDHEIKKTNNKKANKQHSHVRSSYIPSLHPVTVNADLGHLARDRFFRFLYSKAYSFLCGTFVSFQELSACLFQIFVSSPRYSSSYLFISV